MSELFLYVRSRSEVSIYQIFPAIGFFRGNKIFITLTRYHTRENIYYETSRWGTTVIINASIIPGTPLTVLRNWADIAFNSYTNR